MTIVSEPKFPGKNVLNAALTAIRARLAACHAHAYDQGLKLSSARTAFRGHRLFRDRRWRPQPDDIAVLFALGNTAQALGMPAPAAEFFRQVLALEPGRIEALVNLANLLRAQGQFEAAARLAANRPWRAIPKVPELQLTLGSVWRESRRPRTGQALSIAPPWSFAPIMHRRWPIWPIFWRMTAISRPPEHCTIAPSRPDPAMPRPGSTAPCCIF